MRKRRTCRVLVICTIAATGLYLPGYSSATTPKGYQSTLLALGRLAEIDVSKFSSRHRKEKGNDEIWLSMQKTKGMSDMYVQSNVWAPGGSTGWHSHPGHSLIIVTAGTVTNYEGHDPDCRPHAYKTGMAFLDPGGDHIHIIRNEGAIEAKTIAVQFIPADATRRIDVADPGNCHF